MNTKMKKNILLIWPYGFDPQYVLPLSLAYLKSNLSVDKYNVEILDCALLRLDANSRKDEIISRIKKFNPYIVAVSTWSLTYLESIELMKITKSIDDKIITVMGGIHITAYPESAVKCEYVDFSVRGEAESSFSDFIEESCKTVPNYSLVDGLVYRGADNVINMNPIAYKSDLDTIKIPDYDSIQLDKYIEQGYRYNTTIRKNAPILVTRGCPYSCVFCSAPVINGRKIRKHSKEYIINWIKYLYYEKNIRMINIIDDNFTFDTNYAKDVCKEIIKLNLRDLQFGTPNGIRIQNTDKELLLLMRKAGWKVLSIAPESGSKKVLELMNKRLDLDIIPLKVKEIREAKLKVHGLFMIGFPGETREDIKQTVKLIRRSKFDFFFIANFQPLPGTPIYNTLVSRHEIENGLLPANVSDGTRVYTPAGLKDFNFPLFILKEYAIFIITNPLRIFYIIRILDIKMIVKKAIVNIINVLKK